jgi:hypothetical protein
VSPAVFDCFADIVARRLPGDRPLAFADASLDFVMSCAVLEHGRYFWRSTREVQRVWRPGGWFVVGVPIYMTLPDGAHYTTRTCARHGLADNADYFRSNPYLIAAGRK